MGQGFIQRRLEIRYWNAENRIVDSEVMSLEGQLKRLGDVNVGTLKSLDDETFQNCDLLIVAAQKIPEEDFSKWLDKLTSRIESLGQIWVPALILADVSFETLNAMLKKASQQNWYFDIISGAHMSSLPIRVANLVRIHEHMRELFKYASTLDRLEGEVKALQNRLGDGAT